MADQINEDGGNMENQNPQGVKVGDTVTVINAGDHDLFDPNTGVFYPARTEVEVTINRFHEEQFALGNLKIAGSDDAPKAAEGNDKVDATQETDLAKPVDTEKDESFTTDETQLREGDVSDQKLEGETSGRKGRSRRGV